MMEGLSAIDEELDALAADHDPEALDALVARVHEELPDRSEGLETIDMLLENLGEAVSIPTVEPVGIAIPRPELPPARAAEPDTEVHPSVPPEAEAEAVAESEAPRSAVEMAREADAGVDEMVSDGVPSESGLDADALFGDLEGEGDLASLFDDDEEPAAAVAEAAQPAQVQRPKTKPPTMPPPPPVEALGDIEEVDLEDLMIEGEDSFELMIEEDGDTFVGDANEVEAALEAREAAEDEAPATEDEAPATEESAEPGEGDDPREHSFFKKLFG